MPRSVAFQQLVDVLDIVQRVVYEEAQFWNDAQLLAQTLAKVESHGLHVGIDILQQFLSTCGREDAQVDGSHTEVGTDAYVGHRDEHPVGGLRLTLEDLTQLLL